MPPYNQSAFGPPYRTVRRLGTQSTPNYLYGSFEHDTQPFTFQVSQVAVTANVATLTVQLKSGGGPTAGLLPSVGALMGVQGTQSNAGVFNADPTRVTAVSLNANGAGTISYALTSANIAATPDAGTLVVRPYETPDALALGASQAAALAFTPDESDNSRCLFAECAFPTLPTSCTVVLQAANVDEDARYVTLTNTLGTTTVASVAAGAITQNGAQYSFVIGKFLRLKVTALSGAGSIVGTIFC